jgi:signal peptidase II
VREVQEHGPVEALARRVRPWWSDLAGAALVVWGLDRVTKEWALSALDDRTIELFSTVRLRLVFNTGSAFGLGSRFSPLIALVAVVVVLVLLRSGRGMTNRWALAGTGLVVGGALGNLFDRVTRDGAGFLGGPVVDFVDLQWWPVFNVADAAICVGAVLLALTSARES